MSKDSNSGSDPSAPGVELRRAVLKTSRRSCWRESGIGVESLIALGSSSLWFSSSSGSLRSGLVWRGRCGGFCLGLAFGFACKVSRSARRFPCRGPGIFMYIGVIELLDVLVSRFAKCAGKLGWMTFFLAYLSLSSYIATTTS